MFVQKAKKKKVVCEQREPGRGISSAGLRVCGFAGLRVCGFTILVPVVAVAPTVPLQLLPRSVSIPSHSALFPPVATRFVPDRVLLSGLKQTTQPLLCVLVPRRQPTQHFAGLLGTHIARHDYVNCLVDIVHHLL